MGPATILAAPTPACAGQPAHTSSGIWPSSGTLYVGELGTNGFRVLTRRPGSGDQTRLLDGHLRIRGMGRGGGVEGPDRVNRALLRRYLAYLTTRRYARASVSRKAAALRCYFAWLARTGSLEVDPARRLGAPSGKSRLPRVLDRSEVNDSSGRCRGRWRY